MVDGKKPGVGSIRDEGKHTGRNDLLLVEIASRSSNKTVRKSWMPVSRSLIQYNLSLIHI